MGLVDTFMLEENRPFRRKMIITISALVVVNVGLWIGAVIALRSYDGLISQAVLAYTLGLRHALDADHITAIDNVTRKLIQANKRPCLVGLFFSLGHSTIVIVASIAIAATATAVADRFPAFQEVGGVIGTCVSGAFLLLIGIMNAVVLVTIWKQLKTLRREKVYREIDVEEMLNSGGVLARFFRPIFNFIDASWKMYPLGVLFGFGFDTATEITLLALAATQANSGLPIGLILFFPFLFTAGMSLIDTLDGMLMLCTYSWAFISPIRKIYFNFTITFISVVIALAIGMVQVFNILGEKLELQGAFWDFFGKVGDHFDIIGYCIVGFFVLIWIVAAVVYKYGGFKDLEKDIVVIRGEDDAVHLEKGEDGLKVETTIN
ncbi:high-affinity nickel-transporter [Basidiobolus meristosporus CBS 931.73]|uniref:Nickel/cobalt efflux system n=1 Tax=Basidiobolus meristosporus CBS 931.73 TaxID=1314790 RepID=A0A1Y1X3S8_9FUNG|nr:high-affinity nickel-transporter [Basidiobolus meristosporus CBS 931.73]|eukprot:ORX80467.1 high-affinity nickel-transporter [Basidiobolus meristosporus CBS 931.73]